MKKLFGKNHTEILLSQLVDDCPEANISSQRLLEAFYLRRFRHKLYFPGCFDHKRLAYVQATASLSHHSLPREFKGRREAGEAKSFGRAFTASKENHDSKQAIDESSLESCERLRILSFFAFSSLTKPFNVASSISYNTYLAI